MGEFKFHVHMMNSAQRRSALSKIAKLTEEDPDVEELNTLMDELGELAAELCWEADAKAYLKDSGTDELATKIVRYSLKRSMEVSEDIGSFRA